MLKINDVNLTNKDREKLSYKDSEKREIHIHEYHNKVSGKLFRNYTLNERRNVIHNKLKEIEERGIIIRGEIKFNGYYGYHDGTFFILDDELVFFKFDKNHKKYKDWIYIPKSIENIYFPDPTNLGDWEIDHGLLKLHKKDGTIEYNYYSITTSEYDL